MPGIEPVLSGCRCDASFRARTLCTLDSSVSKRGSRRSIFFTEAEKAVPDHLAPYYQAGRITFLQGPDYARSEKCFRKFLTQEPEPGPMTLPHAHWRLGLTLDKLGRRADAIAEMEQATRLKPDFEEAVKDLRRLRGS
jgi:tetratricopeptide (TPR) repeat protein